MSARTRVDFRGPLFQTDAGRTVRKAIGNLVIDVAKQAVTDVKGELYKGHGKASGDFRRGIKRKKRGFTARIFATDARKAAWLQGTSKLNKKSTFEGYEVFTKAAEQTDSTAGQIARQITSDLVRELGG